MRTLRRGESLICAMLLLPFLLGAENATSNAVGTILPPQNAPDFVKEQWKDVVTNGQFAMPKRDWQEVGLPSGLEEQVWNAWEPGAQRVWRSVGPGYANVIYDAKVDSGVISLLLDLGGLVQSKDGGLNWQPVSHHLTASHYYSFDISPANPDIIAVGGGHLDRTLNGGRSWSPVFDQAFPPFKPLIAVPGKRYSSGQITFGAIRFNADGSRIFVSPGAMGHGFAPRYGIEPEMKSWLKRKFIYVGDGMVSHFKAIDLGPFAGVRCLLPHFSNPDLLYASFSDGGIYVCRDARTEKPSFVELVKPDSLKGFQAVCMDVSPNNPDMLLITLREQGDKQDNAGACKSKLILAKVSGDKLECEEIQVGAKDKAPLGFASAKWNPHNPNQVFVGFFGGNSSIRMSVDGMKSFSSLPFPKALLHAEPGAPDKTFAGYTAPHKFEFDRKSDLAITRSVTVGWYSHDQFKTMTDLLMTYDDEKKLYGNKGACFPECGAYIAIRKNYVYITTNDHGAWRGDGRNTAKWARISSNPGMPKANNGAFCLYFPMGVSEDEAFIYLVARLDEYEKSNNKLMLSTDKGDTWRDVTERLGVGATVNDIQGISFDPSDAKNQWILTASKLFVSTDGGQTFKSTELLFPTPRAMSYDSVHKALYAATKNGLMRSDDMGLAWRKLPFSMIPYAVCVLPNGDLAVSDDGRFMIIPYDKIDAGKIDQSMIRMTIGDSVAAAACGQRTFRPIMCRGMDILAMPDNGWNNSNCVRPLGPLLSRDGGKTFTWIVHDLPCLKNGSGLDIRDDKIILGSRGIHELDLNALKLK